MARTKLPSLLSQIQTYDRKLHPLDFAYLPTASLLWYVQLVLIGGIVAYQPVAPWLETAPVR